MTLHGYEASTVSILSHSLSVTDPGVLTSEHAYYVVAGFTCNI